MRELKRQFSSALLIILTVAAVISAGINFQQQKKVRLPDDGVMWVDRARGVEALHVDVGGPGEKAGIRQGDVLHRIGGGEIRDATDVPQALERIGAWNQVEYVVHRSGVDVKTNPIIEERVPDSSVYYLYLIGAAYLFIGLFVYFRRGNAEKAIHFYALCLASFVLFTFHYTGKLNNFDTVIYWGNVAAGLFAPTIFLHFCLIFPEPRPWLRSWIRASLLYLPAAALLALYAAFASGVLRIGALSLVEVRWLLDRLWLPFLALMYLAGTVVLAKRYHEADDPIRRQQMKWIRNGALFGVLPFTAFYVVPYVLGSVPDQTMKMAVFSLALIPVTWAHAIVRYRLMDVDIIFQQGYVYTLTTLFVIGIVYGLVISLGKFEDLSPGGVVLLVLIAVFVFQPVRNWMQEQLDRYYFYKDRYDYRRTLIEFARELSSETDLDAMLSKVADRLTRTISIQHLAFFLADESEGNFRLKSGFGLKDRSGRSITPGTPLDLRFLSADFKEPYLFFERTRHAIDVVSRELPQPVRQTIADLDLTYYLPCISRGRILAYLGVSRSDKGDFLSSDDVELLVTLSRYVGIAIENSRLYRSLQQKVDEYERLKEFNENIVESINVGILAADLDDRVESWNAQMERLAGISRTDALGRTLSELFPEDLAAQFEGARGDFGIQHLYKFPLRLADTEKDLDSLPREASHNSNGNGYENGHGNGSAGSSKNKAEVREVMLNIAIAPLFSKELERIGRLVIFDDVTERTELERRLMQADKLSSVGLLAAGVAHEVNTPLAVISTYAQMLAKQVNGDESKTKLLDKIAKQTFRASEIVNSLLNFSRTSSTAFDEVNLNQVIKETLTLIEHQLQRSGVHSKVDLDAALPPVKGNFGRLQQVFLNLFLNARDAMESGGSLSIKTYTLENTVGVEVIDSGQGIDPDHLDRIYDPFFTTKSARKGTGLGLAVTYGIVKEHGGIIEVESQLGTGTRFHLEFPMLRKTVNA